MPSKKQMLVTVAIVLGVMFAINKLPILSKIKSIVG
jgi:hypothetical protein